MTVLILQFLALLALVSALILYRIERNQDNAIFRIDKVTFYPKKRAVYYIMRKAMFSKWKVWEVEQGIRGYHSFEEARAALEQKLDYEGIEMTESEVMKEYG